MDPNILKTLGLDSKMNSNDINLLNQILSSTVNGNKSQKISAKERNNLINKLSATTTLSELPQKDMKDMNEEEKKIYREELKKKLKNKNNEKKMIRTNNLGKNKNNYNDALTKLNDMMKNIPNDVLAQDKETNDQVDSQTNDQVDSQTNDQVDKINYIINKNYSNTEYSNISPNQSDNLDDYIC
jgi:hypothetical protein